MNLSREDKVLRAFGANLKKTRQARELSTRALADLADLDYSNINEIEKGKNNPTLITILALAEALGVDPGELMKG